MKTKIGFPQIFYLSIWVSILFSTSIQAQWNSFGNITNANINSVFFTDTAHGWAVGDNATILQYANNKWASQTLPFITSTNFKGVSFLNNNLGWAVSQDGLILKYTTAKGWTLEKTDGSISQLNTIFSLNSTNGWAAGSGNYIYYYNGTKWTSQSLPNYSNIYSLSFTDATHGWASGYGTNGSAWGSIIYKYNGTSWTIDQFSATNNYVYSITMLSNTNGWAVGDNNNIYHYNGTTWTAQQSPLQSYAYLRSISFLDATHGWAADQNSGSIIKYNGTSWSIDTTLNNSLNCIKIINNNNRWAVGSSGGLYNYVGGKWNSLTTSYNGLEKIRFTDPRHGWIISNNQILKLSGNKWIVDSSIYNLSDAYFKDSVNGWAVGYGSYYWRFNGSRWTQKNFDNYSYYNLNAVNFTDTSHGCAVGYYGTIMQYSSGKWTKQTISTTANFYGVYFIDPSHGWAVGDSGIIYTYLNNKWTKVNSGTTTRLTSIYFTDATHGWAVGDNETILKYNGTSWSTYRTGITYDTYNSIYFFNNTQGWIVGNYKVLKLVNNNWVEQPGFTDYGYNSIAFADTSNGWIINYSEILKTTNGGKSPYSSKSISLLGKITSPNIWDSDTIKILGNVSVDGPLTIKPGVRVEFEGNYTINVSNGSLNASGTKVKPITFTVNDTIKKGSKVGWSEIYSYSYNSNDSTIYRYCKFDNCNTYPIYASNTYIDISNNTITNVPYGMYLSSIKGGNITSNTIDTTSNYGMLIYGSTNLSIAGNLVKHSNNIAIDIESNSSNITLDTNTIAYNYLGVDFNQSGGTIRSSKICDNSNGAILAQNSKLDIINCLVNNNGFYIGYDGVSTNYQGVIYSDNSLLNILNSTIANNYTTNSYKGGALFYRFTNGNVYNSILWNNVKNTNDTSQVFIFNNSSKPNFYNCDIKFGKPGFETTSGSITYSGTYQNNINVIPQFTTPTTSLGPGTTSNYNALTANWKLKTASTLINQGTQSFGTLALPNLDLADGKRILNGVIDIGGYETRIPPIVLNSCPDTIKGNVTWAADTVRIKSCGVVIAKGANLVIQAGTMVEFWGPYKISVFGSIKALGNASNSVLFTIHDTTGFWKKNTVGWEGIEFDNSNGDLDVSDSSIFKYCTFKNAKDTNANYWYGIGLNGLIKAKFFSKLSIVNSTFSGNKIGLGLTDWSYIGLISLQYSNVNIIGNKFLNNYSPVFYIQSSNGVISNNTIKNNRTNNQYRSLFTLSNSNITFAYNWVSNNISINYNSVLDASSSNTKIINNVFANNLDTANNYYPYTIYCYNGNMTLANNDIVNNSGYGYYFANGVFKAENNIIWGNKYSGYSYSLNLGSTVSNNNIQNYYNYYGDTLTKNIVTDTPRFVSPTQGYGYIYDASKANWKLSIFSPNVNTGAADTTGLGLSLLDFAGNARINGGIIDIGAYENLGSKISFKNQPIGGTICEGDTINFVVTVSDSAKFQWQKDGTDIYGANTKTLSVIVSNVSSGNYTCAATNAYGKVFSNTASVQMKTAPTVFLQPKPTWVNANSSFKLEALFNGSSPIHYQWYKNGVASNNDTITKLAFGSFTNSNEGFYKCTAINSCGMASIQPTSLYVAPQISDSTGNNICQGGTFKLFVTIHDTVNYQWQKDGNDLKDGNGITGASSPSLKVNSIDEPNQGNYTCKVSNANEYFISNPVLLQVRLKPEITGNPNGGLVVKGNSQTLGVSATGFKPLSYQWLQDGINLKGDTLSTFYTDSFRTVDEGNYLCQVSNICGTASSSSVTLSLVPEICMVTVAISDTTSRTIKRYNEIVWNKESKVKYAKFNIYRESAIAGYYDSIGTVLSSKPSVYIDTAVDPKEQAFLYKITGVDNSGNETDIKLCPVSKTIHLVTTYGVQGGIQLEWDQYIGFPYHTYFIYRGINRKGFKMVKEIATSNRSWTDLDTIKIKPKDTLSYFISVTRVNGCNPNMSSLKAGEGLLVESVSNMEDNRLRSGATSIGSVADAGSLNIFPNPFNGITNIEYQLQTSAHVVITLYDIYGNQISTLVDLKQTSGSYRTSLNPQVLNLKEGIYIVEMRYNDKMSVKRLVFTR